MARARLFALLEERIKDASDRALQDMGEGRCRDYPAYQYQCGYLLGMKEVIILMDEIEKQRE